MTCTSTFNKKFLFNREMSDLPHDISIGPLMKNILLLVLLTVGLMGCASHHMVPPLDYASDRWLTPDIDNEQFNVAFDQNGHIYPNSPTDSVLFQPHFDWVKAEGDGYKRHGYKQAFQLKKVAGVSYSGVYYSYVVQQGITQNFAKKLSEALGNNNKLFIYIHGYNNTFEEAQDNIQALMSAVPPPKDAVVLRVTWDGLHGKPGKMGAFVGTKSWWNALTYSNLAGQIGLRQLLQAIKANKPLDVVFVTHSRGAAVAMSSVFDPLYNERKIKRDKTTPLTSKHANSARFIMFAPAIGDGHVSENVISTKNENIDVQMLAVANLNDRSTCKRIGINQYSKRLGDTSLGCGKNEEYIEAVSCALAKQNIEFGYRVISEKSKTDNAFAKWLSHDLEAYLPTFKKDSAAKSCQAEKFDMVDFLPDYKEQKQ